MPFSGKSISDHVVCYIQKVLNAVRKTENFKPASSLSRYFDYELNCHLKNELK